jgi:putative ABC transport system ATP-binding protein
MIASSSSKPRSIDATALKLDVGAFTYADGKSIVLPSFELQRGEIVVLSGRSGSGKSTLLHLVTGVLALKRAQGTIRTGEIELADLSQAARDHLRPHTIGWVPQRVHLISALSVFDNIMLPITLGSTQKSKTKDEFVTRAIALMKEAGIADLANALPAKVSVGQASRACVVRALVANPRVLCADEPSAALDRESAEAVAKLLTRYAFDGGAALIASHDAAFIDALKTHSENVRTLSLEAP